jgi:ribosomal protein L7/L12
MKTKKPGAPNPDVLLKEAKDKKRNALIFYGIPLFLIVGYILVEDYNVSGWAYGGAVVLLLLEVAMLSIKPSDEVKKRMAKYETELTSNKRDEKETERPTRTKGTRKKQNGRTMTSRMADDIEKFDVVLKSEGPNKLAVIGVLKKHGFGLKEAKGIVEQAYPILKEGVSEAEATALKTQLEQAGASVHVRLDKISQAQKARKLSIVFNKDINNLKEKLQNKVDKDANGQVDLIESSVFMETVKTHQKEIQAINPDFVKNFVKLENNLKTRRASIESIFAYAIKFEIGNWDTFKANRPYEGLHTYYGFNEQANREFNDWESNKEFLMGEMKAYTAVQYNAIHMVNALLTDDMITFYEVYEAFDKLEIWHSQYEKISTTQLQSLNDNIRQLIRTTQESTDRIVDSLGDLTYRMAEQNDNLKEIHGAVTAGNLLSAINTFQLHRISKNTKSLRE